MEKLNPEPGQAAYSPLALRFYDFYVLGLSNRYFWRCPTADIQASYNRFVSPRHLEIGVGTGYFLDRLHVHSPFESLCLMDLNENSLSATSRRVKRFNPSVIRANALEPFPLTARSFDSVGINYLIHCLPGTPEQKGVVFDHIREVLSDDGVCFGSTIVQAGQETVAGSLVMAFYNRKGIFGNHFDTPQAVITQLQRCFDDVVTEQTGAVLQFYARKPKR